MAKHHPHALNALRDQFLLDPEIVFLNHGSFGATPRTVFEDYQTWQVRLEKQPVRFLDRELPQHLKWARETLGSYVNVDGNDLVYVPNATFAVNLVARSLALDPGDEVLTTDHEYGACGRVWQFLSKKRGFHYIKQPISLPIISKESMLEEFWSGVTSRTKVIFISHITSETALHMPVEAICARAREAGILTLVDGAHALGQIPLDLAAVGADIYTSNAHKWLCAPKGSAFLYTRPEKQHLIEPLVVGWGWGDERTISFGSDYLDYLQWLGTSDLSAYLAVPAAIKFQARHDWPLVRERCHQLATQALDRICNLTGMPSHYPQEDGFFYQMVSAPLPISIDLPMLKRQLYDDFRIEIPCLRWEDHQFIRLSVQGYNSQADIDRLLEGLESLLVA